MVDSLAEKDQITALNNRLASIEELDLPTLAAKV